MTIRCLAALLACTAVVAAQQRAPSGAEDAIAAFEAVRDDPKKRDAAARKLGPFDDPRTTGVILEALALADDLGFRAALADALGAVPRARAVVTLEELWLEAPGSKSLRRAAAKGLGRQGNDGVAVLAEVLAERVTTDAVAAAQGSTARRLADVRVAGIAGLEVAGGERAWETLGEIATTGTRDEREAAVRALAKSEPSPRLTASLLVAAADDDLEVAALAAGVLGAHGHPKAADTVLKVHRRLKALKWQAVSWRVALVQAFEHVLDDRDAFDPFVRQASFSDADVAEAVEAMRATVTAHDAFRGWLLARGLQRKDVLERCLVIRLLTHAPEPRVTDAFLRAMRDPDPAIVLCASRALAERGDRDAVPELRKLLGATGGGRRLEALFALHGLLKGEPGWEAELLAQADSTDRAMRSTVLDFLADLGNETVLPRVWDDLDDRSWSVRAAAYDYCRRVRSVASIPRLIPRVDAETGRLRHDLLDTLQSLTARRYPTTERWQQWWDAHGEGFELVPLPDEKETSKRSDDARTVTYYDIPLVSDRVAFVVDVSGSMNEEIGTDKKRTRLDEAKRQLRNVIEAIPEDTRINVISFHHAAGAFFDELTPAEKSTRKQALARVEELVAKGGTDVFEALERAFADPLVDTIYLLSDGYPSAGKIQDAEALADEVRRWNRTRQLRIHCIALGSNSKLLRRIAADSGGTYVHFK